MKKISSILPLLLLCFTFNASAQFRPSASYTKDLLGGTPLVLPTAGVTNIIQLAYIGKDGFAITPYFVATNASGSNILVRAKPIGDGVNASATVRDIGTLANNGTTPVRDTIFASSTNFPGVGLVQIIVTNTHLSSITISNLTLSSW